MQTESISIQRKTAREEETERYNKQINFQKNSFMTSHQEIQTLTKTATTIEDGFSFFRRYSRVSGSEL